MKQSKLVSRVRRLTRNGIEMFVTGRRPAICENIVGWSLVRNWDCKIIHKPFTVELKLPTNYLNASAEFVRSMEVLRCLGFPAQHLVVIPAAKVATGIGLVVLPEGAFVCEGKWRVSNVVNHPYFLKEWPISKVHQRSGDWLCAMSYFGANYNHWFWDELPRIANALPYLPKGTQFLISRDAPLFVTESLLSLAIEPDKIVAQEFDEESIVERLWFPTPLGHSEWCSTSSDVIANMRERIWNWADVRMNKTKKLIYVTRASATYRRATNDNQLQALLEKLGFETVHAEKLTWKDQVRCFSQADTIVGIHGAGLTNMLFAPKSTKICELHGPVTRFHYWNMAEICGHSYSCLCDQSTGITRSDLEIDFNVSIEDLSLLLKRIL